MRKAATLVLAAALLAGCGGGTKQPAATGGGPAGAGVAPKSTAFLLRLDTSFQSPQWRAFESLLRMFPGGEKALAGLGGPGTTIDDLRAALGPETDLIALTGADLEQKNANFLGLTQPKDEAQFDSLLAKDTSHPVSEEIAGWRVVSDKRETIDRFKAARNGGTLSGNPSYTESLEGLPPDAIASLYVDGSVLTRAIDQRAKTGTATVPGVGRISWLSAALSTREKAFVVDFRLKGDEIEATPYTAKLPAEVPADVSVFVDVKGLDRLLDELRRSPAVEKRLGGAAGALGGLLDEVIGLFKNEAAFYVRGSGAKPELTLLLDVADEANAQATLDKVATLAGAGAQAAPEPVRIGRFSVQKLTIQKTSVYYGVVDGKLVVTTSRAGIVGLDSARHLADSPGWRSAAAAAGLPQQTAGILYADVPELVKLGKRFSGGSSSVTPQTEGAVDRLGTVLLHASIDGGVLSLKGLVSVR